jgi:hypothetical protein
MFSEELVDFRLEPNINADLGVALSSAYVAYFLE